MVKCDVGIVAINHVTPTSFIHVPTLEMVMAIHIILKTGYWNGVVKELDFKRCNKGGA
jgi:hypothetical protein